MQQLLTYLHTTIKSWRDKRFLKKHGCEDWKQYHYRYDPDIDRRCSRIRDFYKGYPYWYMFENHRHQIYWWDLGYDGSKEIMEWCEQNCKDKFRFDGHRVMNAPATGYEWEMNELGGGDYYFAAFKNERDFNWFLLRWS